MQEKKKPGRPKKDTVLWICDRTRCDPEIAMCKVEKWGCVHTTDKHYAKNKVVEEPSLYPERFVEDEDGVYWEFDQETPLPAWLAELYIKREAKTLRE